MAGRLGVVLPPYTAARVESGELTEVVPSEMRADLVVVLEKEKPVHAILVEVQLRRDLEKQWSWPKYLSSLRARVRCPTVLLVIAPDAGVAAWCRTPIEVGPGSVLTPVVLGMEAVPYITNAGEAARNPELAVLSAMAHGKEEVGLAIAKAALAAGKGLEGEKAKLYGDLVQSSLGKAARAALEVFMKGNYEYQSAYARRYVAEGLQKGLKKGLQKGLEKGREEGLEKALLTVLEARGFSVSAEALERIQGCSDVAQLERWVKRAIASPSVEEVFR